MNRNQRRLGRAPKRNDSEGRIREIKRNESNVKEVLPPKFTKRDAKEKHMTNRCCYVSPDQKEFGQFTETDTHGLLKHQTSKDKYPKHLSPKTVIQLKELRRVLCENENKAENSSHSTKQTAFVATSDGAHWQNIDNTDDIDKFILQGKDEETLTSPYLSKSIHISEWPRVKIIAEKFSKYKQKNVELRKLDEKVVCVEYDVFDQAEKDSKPIQIMRAFFSIRPVYGEEDDKILTELSPKLKNKFNITLEDLQKLSEKEVEMIDGKIAENRPYLDDLRKILRRKQVLSKKNKNSLDLQTLYEMATMEYLNFEQDNAKLLTNEELEDVKNLILKKCKSSVHGINRRTVRKSEDDSEAVDLSAISQSIVGELLRQDMTIIKR